MPFVYTTVEYTNWNQYRKHLELAVQTVSLSESIYSWQLISDNTHFTRFTKVILQFFTTKWMSTQQYATTNQYRILAKANSNSNYSQGRKTLL